MILSEMARWLIVKLSQKFFPLLLYLIVKVMGLSVSIWHAVDIAWFGAMKKSVSFAKGFVPYLFLKDGVCVTESIVAPVLPKFLITRYITGVEVTLTPS